MTWGALVVALRRDETLPLETERRLQAFAELVGLAVASAACARRARRLATAHRRGERHRAAPHRAQPARRRPAATRRALGRTTARPGEAAHVAGTRPSELLDGVLEGARPGLTELRELAQGIHPAVLTERGLDAALEVLAARAPLAGRPRRAACPSACPSRSRRRPTTPSPRRSPTSSSTPRADSAAVRVGCASTAESRSRSRTTASAAPTPIAAPGLRGLRDRVETLDGELWVESAPGQGTRRAGRASRPVAQARRRPVGTA